MNYRHHAAIMRATALVAVCAVAGALACSSETSVPTNIDATLGQAPSGRTGGTDTSGSQATSNGPVASLTISPHQLTLPMGYYTRFLTTPRDAQGLYVVGKRATWRSSNSAVLVASDSGIFYAKALGSAMVYGTIDGQIDSASVVVIAAVTPGGDTAVTPPPPATPLVSAFNLTVSVDGPLAGADTTKTQHIAGTTVAVTRVMGVHGDTLNPSVLAGTITTDANGGGTLQNLPGGYYTLVATPPTGSAYITSSFGIGAPTTSDVKVRIILMRRVP